MKRCALFSMILVLIGCTRPEAAVRQVPVTVVVQQTVQVPMTVEVVKVVTATPSPIPQPRSTPTVEAQCIELGGQGDAIVPLEVWDGPALVFATASDGKTGFEVGGYDDGGEFVTSVVQFDTTPYEGVRLFGTGFSKPSRLQVETASRWTLRMCPVWPEYMHTVDVPGTYEGNGDDVVFLAVRDRKPDTVKVTYGQNDFIFVEPVVQSGFGLGWVHDIGFLSDTGPLETEKILDVDTICFDVEAHGPWSIEVTAR